MKATIYDVAREAGVSIATVSNVVNGKGKLSKQKRDHILKIMEELEYRPSMIAAALTGKKTYTIGLLVPDISNPFFAEIARAVEEQGHHRGYSVIICSTDNQDGRAERYLDLLEQKRVDGIIIGTGIENTEILKRLLAKSIPVAMIAREFSSEPVHTVVVDDFIGGMHAAQHLLELGHTSFGILSESKKVSSSRERVRGLKQALKDEGLSVSDENLMICDYKMEDGKRKALELFQQVDRPSALFCCNDMLAVGALQAAKELGIQIPQDLSIVSFDNTILASVTDPPLTSIAQPMEYMGKLVVDLLIQELEEEQTVKQRIVLPPELVVRQSTSEVRK
ncbi:LacI family transcriptional regulator [Paenibacillus sp. KQZ6P-2]|uniref:LacI family transcriptional regulator n=1 Tax=Paenibacillus mangrovi TaxID=2931978 RepID=A0A9X1WUF6_9BACL|nr:LacI family DNA-binding transcriptional regulator [Paenibacillus mangrovi]MCJ8014110.1 LacI family transcriptional regulator [Paenibacillus mangrovi]